MWEALDGRTAMEHRGVAEADRLTYYAVVEGTDRNGQLVRWEAGVFESASGIWPVHYVRKLVGERDGHQRYGSEVFYTPSPDAERMWRDWERYVDPLPRETFRRLLRA